MNLNTKQAGMLLAGGFGLALVNIIFLNIIIIAFVSGALIGHAGIQLSRSLDPGRKAKAIEAAKIDGRTQKEWYDLISVMTKEEYEKLSRPALDGLEGSSEGYGGWDIKRLLTTSDYHKVMRGWYPDQYCGFCEGFTNGIPGNCMWDGPCHGYVDDQRYRSHQIIRDLAVQRIKDRMVVKSPPKIKAVPVKELKAELVRWDGELQKSYYDYNYYHKKCGK